MFIQADALQLPLQSNTVSMVITSPPYGVGMNYEQGDVNPRYYWGFTERWLRETYRVLRPGGYAAINIPLSSRAFGTAFYPKFYWLTRVAGFEDCDFSVVWVKRFEDSGKLVQHQLQKPKQNGRLRIVYSNEMIVGTRKPGPYRVVGVDLTGDEMRQWGPSVWTLSPAERNGHPAPFPKAIPYRLIKILSNPGDRVLDPFSGSGTSAAAAAALGRVPIGIDISWNYLKQRYGRR